jgi:predicted O-linked N-acetylglucosamine transferase (SPINDLY family)
VLDNFVYGAHTTASDALWAAVPVLTLRGVGAAKKDVIGRMQSRVGASLLSAVQLDFLAAHSLKEFDEVGRIPSKSS